METKKKKIFDFNFRNMLLLFALVPMLTAVLVLSIYFISTGQKELKSVTHNYLYSMAVAEGEGLYDEYKLEQEEALTKENLTAFCSKVKLEGVESSYAYVADANGTMLWHPTADKIGQPVTNETILGVCANMKAGKRDDANVVEYKFKGEMKYASYWVSPDKNFVMVISCDEKEIMSEITTMVRNGIIIAIVIIVVFVAYVIFQAMIVVKPLNKVVNALQVTAEGDLTVDTNIKSIVTETQELVVAAGLLQQSLIKVVSQTQSIGSRLNDGAYKVESLSGTSKDGADQISSAMEDLAQGATSMAENTQDIAGQVATMSQAVEEIAASANVLATASEAIKVANGEASAYVNKVAESSENSVMAVGQITDQIYETNKAVDEIRNAVDMISEIAGQTNLLALNASIEAARAGEAGRGFAVVATEIKSLSDQSNASADQIKKIVQDVIEKSERSVSLSSQVAQIINEEQGFVKETQAKFEVLGKEVASSLVEIELVNKKVNDLESVKAAISSSVSDLSAISEENAASNEEVSASSISILNSINDIFEESVSTKQSAEELNSTVGYFKL